MALFEPVFRALDTSGARFVVVGGVAVVLQGHARLTADLDLVVGEVDVRVASIPHLIAMKRRVGRVQDREDVARLEEIQRDREVADGG